MLEHIDNINLNGFIIRSCVLAIGLIGIFQLIAATGKCQQLSIWRDSWPSEESAVKKEKIEDRDQVKSPKETLTILCKLC